MRISTLTLMLVIVALGACSRDKANRCSDYTVYLEAGTIGQLRIPDDLSVPDELEALRIPAVPEDPSEDDQATECLEHSPAFETVRAAE